MESLEAVSREGGRLLVWPTARYAILPVGLDPHHAHLLLSTDVVLPYSPSARAQNAAAEEKDKGTSLAEVQWAKARTDGKASGKYET